MTGAITQMKLLPAWAEPAMIATISTAAVSTTNSLRPASRASTLPCRARVSRTPGSKAATRQPPGRGEVSVNSGICGRFEMGSPLERCLVMKLASVRNFLKDSSVAKWRKALLLGAIAYVVLPFDAIPDTIPVLGWLDDLGLLSIAASAVWKDLKRHSEKPYGVEVIGDRA